MELASASKFVRRSYDMIYTFPKIFLCGFLWEGFGLACKCSVRATSFYFMTGLGGAIGTSTGHILAYVIPNIRSGKWKDELWQAALYGLAIFLGPGTTWQKIVNDCADWNIDFNAGLIYMWGVSAILFSCSLMGLRFLNEHLLVKVLGLQTNIATAKEKYYYDAFLAISVGLADAVFVGTVTGWGTGENWLGPAFGVHPDTLPLVGMIKSGASTLVGFICAQLIQNMIVKDCWLDPVEEKEDDDTTQRASGELGDSQSYKCFDVDNPMAPAGKNDKGKDSISHMNA